MSRKPGERNWEDELPYELHHAWPERPERTKLGRLKIESLSSASPSYEVQDQSGNLWLVIMAADGQFEVTERPEHSYPNVEVRILKAVARYHKSQP